MADQFSPDILSEPTLGGPMQAPMAKPDPRPRSDPLESEEARRELRQLEEWMEVEKIRQAPNRYQQAIDDDFYDNLQWADEDAQELASRGQAPLVYNKIQPAVKWITGTEKRTRFDYKIFPRKDAAVDDAENKTKVMKYVDDVNKSGFTRSKAFEQCVRVGVGWLECGVRGDPTMLPIYDRAESWRNMIYDSQSVELDLSDARYVFRHKWVDLDVAQALFPKKKEAIRAAAVYSDFADQHQNDEWYLGMILQERSADGSVLNRRTFIDTSSSLFNRRARVRLNEAWYRKPVPIKYIHAPTSEYHGNEFDEANPEHVQLISDQIGSTYDRMGMRVWCAIFIQGQLLQRMKSPYKHNDFPFTPIWANRRSRDNAPYGVVRLIRDPQESFNKRMSKALFAISTRRVIMDEGAVEDIDELREEAARPDAIIVKKVGRELELRTDMDIAEEHIKYAQLDEKAIQDNSGVTDELLGRKTNAVSGIAIERRQDQGSTVTTDYFDNYRLAMQLHGQKKLSLIRQYMTQRMQIRVIGTKAGNDFITINELQPDGSVLNDITQTEADFVIDETDYRTTQRQAMFETMMQMITELGKINPQFAMNLVDDVLEFSDVPGKEQIIATIRQMLGKPDPNKRMSSQEQQAIEQKQAQQQAQAEEQKQLVLDTMKAKIGELAARANKLNADAAASGAGDGGQLADSYNQALQKLNEDAARMQDELRKQILILEKQVTTADVRSLDHTQDAQIKLQIAREANESKERIAALNARALEATGKVDRQIEGLKEQEAELSRMVNQLSSSKLDKPVKQAADPFAQLHDRIARVEESRKADNAALAGHFDRLNQKLDSLKPPVTGPSGNAPVPPPTIEPNVGVGNPTSGTSPGAP